MPNAFLRLRSLEFVNSLIAALCVSRIAFKQALSRASASKSTLRVVPLIAAFLVVGDPFGRIAQLIAKLTGPFGMGTGLQPSEKQFKGSALKKMYTILLTKLVLKRSLEATFLETYEQVDPVNGKELREAPKKFKRSLREKVFSKVLSEGLEYMGMDQESLEVLPVLGLGLTLKIWRNEMAREWLTWLVPLPEEVLAFIPAVLQYFSLTPMLGSRVIAFGLSALAMIPGFEDNVMDFVELWTSARILSLEVMGPFMDRFVHQSMRIKFISDHLMTLVGFLILPALMTSLPVLGPPALFLAYALGAYALDRIMKKGGKRIIWETYGQPAAKPTKAA